MRPEMVAAMPITGEYGAWSGPMKPSTRVAIPSRHHARPARRRRRSCIIHPTYGCALAMLHKPILAAHYMIALFGGPIVKCVKYAPYGTKELVRPRRRGTGRSQRGSARQSRRARRRRRDSRQRDEPRARTRESRAHVLSRDLGGPPRDPVRRRGDAHGRALQDLWRRRRSAQGRARRRRRARASKAKVREAKAKSTARKKKATVAARAEPRRRTFGAGAAFALDRTARPRHSPPRVEGRDEFPAIWPDPMKLFLLRFFTWWNGATLNTLFYTAVTANSSATTNSATPITARGRQDRSGAGVRAPLGDLQRRSPRLR